MNALFAAGGPVLWILLVLAVAVVAVYLERSFILHRSRINETDLLAGIANNLGKGNATEAIVLCDETPGPVARLVGEAIRQRHASHEDLVAAIRAEKALQTSVMERRLSVLALIAQGAPVLGLIGTVLSLHALVRSACADAPLLQTRTLLQSLLPALVNAAAGLAVALPAYVAFNVLVVKIDRLVVDMEHAESQILHLLNETIHARAAH